MVRRKLTKYIKKNGGYEFWDIMLGIDEKSSQIDNILLTKKALFVFEVKNYRGKVYGEDTQDKWFQTIKYVNERKGRRGRRYSKTYIEKNSFYNPILQNRTHINRLKEEITSLANLPLINVVVFANRTDLKNIKINDPKNTIIKRNKLIKYIKRTHASIDKEISQEQMIQIFYEIIKKNRKTSKAFKNHVNRIKEKWKN